ncbi:MAG: hypothetical protein HYS86_02915 [Candidatus Chisholmbacteria bacterium]|nr:hypothetical protein [Candidatus Chisholmbacteria bacterium]
MGAFFGNIALKTKDRNLVKDFVKQYRHLAYISPSSDNWIIIYDKYIEGGPGGAELAKDLSSFFNTTAIYFLVHDSDFLFYNLCFKGKDYDGYISGAADSLDFFGMDKASELEKKAFIGANKGEAKELVKLCAKRSGLFNLTITNKKQLVGQVSKIMKKRYTFSEERLRDLASALGLPSKYIDIGFKYLQQDGPDIYKEDFDNFILVKGSNKELAIRNKFTLPKAEKDVIGSIYNRGDCLSFKLGKNSFGGLLVVDRNEKHISGSTVNLIAVLSINQKIKPTLKDFKRATVIQLLNCYVEKASGKTDFDVVSNIKIKKQFNNSNYTYASWRGIVNSAKRERMNGGKGDNDQLTVQLLIDSQ